MYCIQRQLILPINISLEKIEIFPTTYHEVRKCTGHVTIKFPLPGLHVSWNSYAPLNFFSIRQLT